MTLLEVDCRAIDWKVYGPDLDGRFGSLQGTGGLEATILDAGGAAQGVINDQFGNGVATVSGNSVTWNATRVGAYGPLPGTTASALWVTLMVTIGAVPMVTIRIFALRRAASFRASRDRGRPGWSSGAAW
jgi:hypothetical protein